MIRFLKNYFSTLSFLGILFVFYSTHWAFIHYVSGEYSIIYQTIHFSGKSFFLFIIGLYALLLIPFYIKYTSPSKALILYQYISKKWKHSETPWTKKETNAILSWIVKWFFGPMMLTSLLEYGNIGYVFFTTTVFPSFLSRQFFDTFLYPTLLSIIFLVDLVPFVLGYCLEGKLFNNTIRSVNPYLWAWCFALLCYYPFYQMFSLFLWSVTHTYPYFHNTYVHIFFCSLLLIFIGIYARASPTLGLKASNLTNRWIVSHGPYKYIRHPAYVCKNIARWIGILPFLTQAIADANIWRFVALILGISGVSFVYYMRALSEEWHLNEDPEYIQYKKKVPHRFFPW